MNTTKIIIKNVPLLCNTCLYTKKPCINYDNEEHNDMGIIPLQGFGASFLIIKLAENVFDIGTLLVGPHNHVVSL